MKRLLIIIIFSVLFAGLSPLSAQNHFRVIAGIPHLPLIDPASVTTPETGMLIYSSVDSKPMIYTGSSWETLCTENINSITEQEYFVVKNGIPFLPTLGSIPTGLLASGTIYYSTIAKSVMIYNGSGWVKMMNLLTGTIADNAGFSSGVGVKTFKLPVLTANPSPIGLVAGAFYINSLSKVIRYYDGSLWQDISCQPVVKTIPITAITGYTAESGAEVLTNGGSPVTLTGICWSPNAYPDTLLTSKTRVVTSGSGIGTFASQMTGLLPLTTYHVRAYAVNNLGIVYGDEIVLTTPIALPTIITLDATNIKPISVETGGDITADGGSSVTKRGVIWSAVSDPLNDASHILTNDGSGVGYYPTILDGLLGNTSYYVRAYAVNAAGTAYGNLVQFTTPAPVPPELNPTLTVDNITGSSMVGTALILNNGGALVTERGVCYSTDQINYTYVPSSTVTLTDIGKFITKLTGLTQGTTYYLKGYAKNSAGIGYTSETSSMTAALASIITVKPTITGSFTAQSGGEISNTGYSTITQRGICWSITKNPTIDSLRTSDTVTGDGTGTYASNLSSLLPGTTYYVRAYAVNAAGIAYGNLDSIAMPDYAKVQTLASSSLYMTTATCGGNVLSDGGAAVTSRGVCWSISANPTISNPKTSDGDGLGLFTSYLTALTPDVNYHYRAYAVNSVGVSYGDDMTFTIIPDAPYIITLPVTEITSMSGNSGGDIQSSGGAPITLRGIIWSTTGDPRLDPSHIITNDGSGVGIFPTKMANLLGNTTYYVRAYAVNSYGKSYGDLKVFTTLPPVLAEVMPATFDIKYITGTSAIGEFLILNNGGDPITDRGIRYTTDWINYTYVSSTTLNPTDVGTFVSKLTGLTPNTTYYAQAYAINYVGTALSTETSFRTSTPATITTIVPTYLGGTTVSSGGVISNTGYSIITSRGICWSTDKNPTIDMLTRTSDPVVGDGPGTYTSKLTGLLPGTTYYVRAYADNSAGIAYGNLDSISIPNYATVLTLAASSLYGTTATCGGNVLSDGGAEVTQYGVCWSTSANPTIANTRTYDGAGLGLFTSYLLGLTPNVDYHFRAYAVNSVGVAYGDDLTLKVIPDAPTIITLSVTAITSMSGNSGGDIQSSGGSPITKRGILWSISGDPLTNPSTTTTTNDGSGVGIFPTKMDNLLGSTTYYVRAYAVNSYGTAYGDLKIFTTLPPILPEILPPTFSINDITNYTAIGEFLVKNNGGDPVTDRGIRYSTDGVNYTYVSSTTLNKTDIGTFRSKLTGLVPNTTYYAQSYAINNVGMALSSEASFRTTSLAILTTTSPSEVTGFTATSGGDITSTGDDIISAKGICWSTEINPTVNLATKTSEAISGIGTGSFVSHISGLTPGVKYYVRAYAVNSFGVAYGNLDSLFTATMAFVTTTAPTNITNISATTGGYVNRDGNRAVTTRGVCWSTHPNPTTVDSYIASGSGIGSFAVTLTSLTGSTKYYVRAYAINSVGTSYGNLDSIKTSAPKLEAVSTTDVINIGGTTALGRGYVGKIGGTEVTERGFCWNTTGGSSVDGEHAACGTSGNGSFSVGLTGLSPNTKYYARAYAANSVGVSYGDEITFSTFTIATVITTPASEITNTTAKSGGDIVSDGGALVYSSGICWNTTGTPTISDASTNSGLGIGNFIHTLTGLMGSTKYYIRAYAINDAGTAYGNVEVFTTAPPVAPTLTTTAASSGGSGTTGTSGGTINSNGGALINTQGVVWSTTSGFLPDTVTVNKTVLSGTGNFSSTLTHLTKGTTYYVRAYATNSAGTSYAANEISFTTFDVPVISTVVPYDVTNVAATSGGNITSNGGTVILESGLCWSTDILPSISNSLYSNGPAFGLFYRTITETLGSTTYSVRAYAINSVGIVYGQVESFTTAPPTLATIITTQPVATSSVTGVSGGNVVSHGGSLVSSRGIYWSTQSGFDPDTITVNKTAQTGYYKGSFTAYMSGLLSNTVYYVRAYVENSVGIAYGDEMSFKTPTLATLSTNYAYATGPTKAVSGGNISTNGGATVSSRGVLWSRVPDFNPDTVTLRTYNGSGSGNFGSTLTELKGNTTYYVQAYATNIAGTSYGNIVSFITDPATLATLSTREAWDVYGTSATSGGYVSDNGGEPILSRGMVWATTPDFRPDTVVVNKAVQGAMGLGYFSTGMGGLRRGTTYYACAYATNSIGVAYGNVISFTTLDFATLTTMPVSPSSTGYAASGGGTLLSGGGTSITNNGVCWSTSPNPTVGLHTKTTYDSWSGSNFYSGLTDLAPATQYYVRAYANNNQGVAYGNEVSFTTPVALPIITTNYVTQTSKSSVLTGGTITFNGGGAITERGVIWSTDASFDPDTVVVNKTSNGVGSGNFNSVISGMQLSISYYIRAYAVNSAGISYGNQVRITLFPTSPILNTLEITQVKGSSAMSGGEITSDGGADVTLKGLCWSTSTNPTTSDTYTRNGFGTDTYTAALSGLLPNTLYYVRAYAINKIGTAYGIERTFQTNGVPTLTATTPVTNIIATTATSGGEITDDGRSPILSRGICWSTYSNPTIALTTKTVDTSSSTIGSFIANMKGLTPATTYYVRSYATNEVGTGYGSQVQFSTLAVQLPTLTTIPPFNVDSVKATSGGDIYDDGGMPITAKGICWSTTPNPTMALATRITYPTAGDSTYTSIFAGLSPGTKYYVRAFAVNSKGTGYGNQDSLTTQVIHATVSDVVISNITKVTANGAASVITDGGAPVTVRGLCWNLTGHPTIADDTLNVGSGLGNFADTLKNLVEGKIYYVRAFATNSAGISYSAVDATFQICPSAFTVLHYEGLNGAAVTKTVTYGSVSTSVSGASKCWITQNLGADRQATSATDNTEASAGWYWQFNRVQGYQYTTARYPLSWASTINETSDWVPANDPCNLLLGNGWRIPTSTEWTNADGAPQNWANSANTYSSVLKLHSAGYLYNGTITNRGIAGAYWGANQSSATNAGSLQLTGSYCGTPVDVKNYGFSLRCLRDSIVISAPSVSNVTIAGKSKTTVVATAAATPDGGAPVTARGFCWNTTGTPDLNDHVVAVGDSVGIFTDSITGLVEGTTYYIRAFATNSVGTTYSSTVTQFKVCLPQFTVQHIEGIDGAPVDKTVTYHSVSSTISGKAVCWLTQNLGADHQAATATDATEASAGWYWQFNRVQGFQYTTARYPSPWVSAISENSDWILTNDPCSLLLGTGWRIPTNLEWGNVDGAPQNWNNSSDTYNSILKLHTAGYLYNGTITNRGVAGAYWGANQNSVANGGSLQFGGTFSLAPADIKNYGFSLRCLRDTVMMNTPTVRNVTLSDITSSSAGVSAIVTPDGGSPVTERGFCWNTTGNPTVTDSKIIDGSTGTGRFSATLSGLAAATTYYVRAYATNSLGTGYSLVVDSFMTNLPLSVSSITPPTGPTAGGTNVTITGTNFILPNSGGDASWTTVSGKTLPSSLYGSQQAVIGNKIYLFGGYNGSAYVNTIFSAPVSDPTIWSNTGKTLPGNLYGSQLATVGNNLYLFGGHNGTATNVIYTASISDPTAWTVVSGKMLPGNLYLSQLATVGNNLYLFGGHNGSAYMNVIYTAPVSDPTTWTVVSGKTLPGNLYGSQVTTIGNALYLFGGDNGSTFTNVIYTAPVSDPTTWTVVSGKTLPAATAHAQLITVGDSLYLLGGSNGSASVSSIFTASITAPTTWTTSASTLPAALRLSSVAIVDDYAYLFGGHIVAATNAIYRAPLTHNRPNVYNKPWLTNWRTIATDHSNVTIGGNKATYINFTSATSIIADTPPHPVGTADVVVTNYDGQSAILTNGFTYLAPTISSISPDNGSTEGGTTVTITGANFVGSVGTGSDGSITIDANKNINTDAIATGRTCADAINYSVTALTANTATLSTAPAVGCLAVGDEILLINQQGTSTKYANVGNYETLRIQSISSNVVTFTTNKTKYYGNNTTDDINIGVATTNQRVMFQRVPNYTDVTINSGVTLTADAWDGTKGGVLYFKASGTVTNNGSIDMSGKGYRGGSGNNGDGTGRRGESSAGYPNDQTYVGYYGAGGGGRYLSEDIGDNGAGGGGGSYGTTGSAGSGYSNAYGGFAGAVYGMKDLSALYLGSGGGGGGGDTDNSVGNGGSGGKGGGIILLAAGNLLNGGSISSSGSNGANAYDPGDGEPGSGGGGAGGSILFNVTNSGLGSDLVLAKGGVGGSVSHPGGAGGVGRVAMLYRNNISGSSVPDVYSQQILGGETISVSFGGTIVFGTVVNSTTIVVTTPAHTAGLADVTVTNCDGESATFSNGYTYIIPPTVNSITPASSLGTGGGTVTISGSDFVGTPTVKFGETEATSVSRIDANTLSVVVPAHVVGTFDVIVTNPDLQVATLANAFTFAELPLTVSSISPSNGPTMGGTDVTITGTNFILPNLGGDTGWATVSANTLPSTLYGASQAVVGDKIYLFGGNNGSVATNIIYSASVSDPTAWSNTGNTLPGNLYGSQVATIGNNLYLFGGYNGTAATNVIYTASLSDPTNWIVVSGKTLPGNLYVSQLAVTDNSLYLFGGYNGTAATNVIYTASVSDPTTWSNTGKTLPNNLYGSQVATIGNKLYLFGGYNGSAYTNAIYTASVSDPTTWTLVSGKTLPAAKDYAQLVIVGDSLYLLGGYNGSASVSSIFTASITDPTTWTASTSTLPAALHVSSVTVIDDYAYLLGGYTTVATNAIYRAHLTHNRPNVYNKSWLTNWRTISTDQSNVTIGGNQATNINFVSPTSITATTPSHTVGATDVTVTNYDGQTATLMNGFIFNSPPTVSSITPPSSLITGGNTVTISGSDFFGTPTVKFGGTDATSVSLVDANTLSVVVPAHASGTFDIVVTNPDLQSDTLAFTFEELPPTISSITPDNGPTAGGTNVTITGTNFILPNSGGDAGWAIVTGKTLPSALYGSQQAVIGDKIYLFGGYNGSTYLNVIYSAPVSDPTTWTNTGKTLPGSLYWSNIVRVADKLYLFGGHNGASMNTIYSASVSDPTTWTNTGKTLPISTHASQILTIGDYVYLFGGYSTSLFNAIYRAPVSDPTNWINTGKTLPTGSYTGVVSVIGDHVYIFGGNTGSYTNIIYSAPVSDPTTWTNTGKTLPGALGLSQMITIGNFNYLLGGYNGSVGKNTIYKSLVSDPTTWTVASGVIPAVQYGAQVAVIDDFVYLFGGYNTVYSSAIYRAPLTHNRPNVSNKSWMTNWRTIATDQSNVIFGGNQAANINFASPLSITATTPAHTVGATDVTITNYDGKTATLTNGFTFNAPPTISNITPPTSLITGGNTVTISGSAFFGTPKVKFGGIDATSVSFVDAHTLNVVVPAHASGTFDVVVTNPDFQADTLAFAFEELAPTISLVTPNNGPTAGGTDVTITGTNFIQPNSGGDAGWAIVSGKTLPGNLYGTSQAIIGDKIYLFGGHNGSIYVNVIYSAPVSDPTNWTNTGKTLPGNLYLSQLATVGNNLYLFGGHNGTAVTNVIYTASVSDPTTWTVVSGKTLPGNLYMSQLTVTNNSLYLFGGSNGTATTNVIYTASVSDPTTWSNTGKTLPGNLYGSQVTTIGNNLYLFGGYNGSAYTNVIYTAPVSDPITWTKIDKTLPVINAHAHLVTIGDSLYLLGGYNSSVSVSSIFKASITDPTTWTTSANTLPAALRVSSVAMIDNYAYLFGGYTTAATSAIYRAPLIHNRPNVYNKPWLTNWRTIASDQSNVTIGGNQATYINFANSTSITATTPGHSVDATDVVVTNYDGQSATLTDGFTYLPPTISSVSPNNGPTAGGTNVTITGANFFGSDSGTGLDGSVTIAANKNTNTDVIATGRTYADAINFSVTVLTANTATLSVSPAAGSLAVGDEVLLINLQGTNTNNANVGNYETLKIQSISSNVVTFSTNKKKYYGNGTTDDSNIGVATTNQRVMLQRVPNYTDVTINSGITLTADAWDGTKGGVVYFKASGTVINNGTIDMSGKGYRGGSGSNGNVSGRRGESNPGYPNDQTYLNYYGAGGGGRYWSGSDGDVGAGGGGGSYGTAGGTGLGWMSSYGGYGGAVYGTKDISTAYLGSGGGGGAGDTDNSVGNGGSGGRGGGIIMLAAGNFINTGSVNSGGSNGANAYDPGDGEPGSGGGGAGGSILCNVANSSLGSDLLLAKGGAGGSISYPGGVGGEGRVAILYRNNFLGSTTPDAYVQQIFGGSSISVSFGGNIVFGTVVNSTTIVVVTPAHTAGATDVTVTNPDGVTATLTNGYTYW